MTISRLAGLFRPATLQGFPSSELDSTPIADLHQANLLLHRRLYFTAFFRFAASHSRLTPTDTI
jgi:hypothetical protein